jgi:hypothetical protein
VLIVAFTLVCPTSGQLRAATSCLSRALSVSPADACTGTMAMMARTGTRAVRPAGPAHQRAYRHQPYEIRHHNYARSPPLLRQRLQQLSLEHSYIDAEHSSQAPLPGCNAHV